MDISSKIHFIDYSVVAVYVVTVLSIGFWVSFRKGHTEDLFLAGRDLNWANIGLSIFGANVSPSMMIGCCGVAFSYGMVGSNFEWLAWVFLMLLAMVFMPHYLNTKISTMPEFMSRRYGNSCRSFLSWYVVFTTLWMWVGGTLFAGGILLSQILGWPLWVSFVLLAAIGTSFTIFGGLTAIAFTDMFQSGLIIVASAISTIIGVVKVGGIDAVINGVPDDFWVLFRPASDALYPWTAILLGYPVLGIWFWCTDQTIVQKVLGARSMRHGQAGTLFASVLKIMTPFIFFMPGILCRILHPELKDPNEAYMTMVSNYLPVGMVGLIIAVLVAALVSTINAGLNSLSTVFTLDIYVKMFRPQSSQHVIKRVGQIVVLISAIISVVIAMLFSRIQGLDLFGIGQSMISFLAPSMASVFLIGVLWKRATSQAALLTLVLGNIVSMGIGYNYIFNLTEETRTTWPSFLLLSFYLFVALSILMIVVSLFTPKPSAEHILPSIREGYKKLGINEKPVWLAWLGIAIIMGIIYFVFN